MERGNGAPGVLGKAQSPAGGVSAKNHLIGIIIVIFMIIIVTMMIIIIMIIMIIIINLVIDELSKPGHVAEKPSKSGFDQYYDYR